MDISKAKKLIELNKEDKKVLVTLFEGGQISSCVEAAESKYCETCQGDDELCNDYVEHLKSQGYTATEYEVGKLDTEESLPRFLAGRDVESTVHVIPRKVESAISGTDESLPGSGETPPGGE